MTKTIARMMAAIIMVCGFGSMVVHAGDAPKTSVKLMIKSPKNFYIGLSAFDSNGSVGVPVTEDKDLVSKPDATSRGTLTYTKNSTVVYCGSSDTYMLNMNKFTPGLYMDIKMTINTVKAGPNVNDEYDFKIGIDDDKNAYVVGDAFKAVSGSGVKSIEFSKRSNDNTKNDIITINAK